MRSSAVWQVGLAVVVATSAGAQALTFSVADRTSANVSVAARGTFVVAVWSASEASATDVFAATSTNGGVSFAPTVRVNATPGDARVGGEQPPRVVLVPGAGATPAIVVVWTTKGEKGTRLLSAKSTDGGRTFGRSQLVGGSEAAGNRGWESVAVTGDGRVLALWLDHRNTASAMPATMHQHDATGGTAKAAPAPAAAPAPKPDPVKKAQLSQLYIGVVGDKSAAKAVAAGVCYCCKTSLAANGSDVFATWRHVFPGNQRDIAFAASHDGGRTFDPIVRVSEDKWQFDGCPENGPAVARAGDGTIHVAWVTPLDGKDGAPLALYHATSRDGRTFTARTRVPSAPGASHVQLAATENGGMLLAWDEPADGGRRIRLARVEARNGSRASFTRLADVDATDGVYPSLAATTQGGVVAWVRRGTGIGIARVP
mgnify:CR=1 FL=1